MFLNVDKLNVSNIGLKHIIENIGIKRLIFTLDSSVRSFLFVLNLTVHCLFTNFFTALKALQIVF